MEPLVEAVAYDASSGGGQDDGLACYVYCVVVGGEADGLEEVGIEGRPVSLVGYRDIGALAHPGPAHPYRCADEATVAAWVMAHHRVVEAAWERWSTVLPMAFNTIVAGSPEVSAEERLREWLKAERERLLIKLGGLRGKAEYGLQLFWNPEVIARRIIAESPELGQWSEKMEGQRRGLAYMYRQQLERLLRKGMEARASEQCEALYERVRRFAEGMRVEKAGRSETGRQMVVNLSCLLAVERYPELKALAGEVAQEEGCFVRLVGPLPPYSFC